MGAGLGRALLTNRVAQIGELMAVSVVGLAMIKGAEPFVGDNPLVRQGVVWVANVLILVTVWIGLRLRGQNFSHFGLSLRFANKRSVAKAVLLSILVFFAAVAAFIVGAVVMANIVGMPEGDDIVVFSCRKF